MEDSFDNLKSHFSLDELNNTENCILTDKT